MPQQVVGGFLFFIFCKEWREGFFGEGRGAMLRDRFSDQIKVTFHIRQKPVCDSAGVDVDFGSESRDMWAVKHTEIHTHTTEQLTSVKTLRLRCFRFCYGGSKLVFVCYSYMLYAICLYVHIVFLA